MKAVRNWEQRIERLKQRMGAKQGPQLICIGPNLERDNREETPWSIKISPGVWATAFGASFSSEDIKRLRREHADGGETTDE